MAIKVLGETGLNKLITLIKTLVATKQDTLTFDNTPTANSTNPVTSGGVKAALPTKVSDLTNDSGYLTTETDPVFTASAAHGISSSDITAWNNKGTYSKPAGGIPKTDLAEAVQVSLGKADTALQSYTETDPTVPAWAKAENKPSYTAQEVGALPANTSIPSKTSDLTNDSGFITTADIPEGAAATTTSPKMDGTATVGTELAFARGDHIHPTDTSRAPLASPTFTGTPLITTTPTAGDNSHKIADTAFVKAAIDAAKVGAATFQGTAPTTFAPTNYKKGYYWVVATAGTYVGEACEPGDMIFAVDDYSSSYSASDFSVVQNNIDMAAYTANEVETLWNSVAAS